MTALWLAVALAVAQGERSEIPIRDDNPVSSVSSSTRGHDYYCGPRCFQYVMSKYGKEEDLVDLVRELQWPHVQQGTTIADLRKAFEQRGIHCKTIFVSHLATFAWDDPAIVLSHSNDGIGHYVVWEPAIAPGTGGTIWYPLSERTVESTIRSFSGASGTVLLTSALPITAERINDRLSRRPAYALVITMSLALIALFALFTRRASLQRCRVPMEQ